MEPAEHVYLDVDDAIGAYAEVFGCSEQEAVARVRNGGGLEAAMVRPAWNAFYQGADLATQSAALAHGIAERQVFLEGNKRTALAVMLAFLEVNGYQVMASDEDLAQWILDLIGGLTVEDLATRLRAHLVVVSVTPR
jgi:death-on-curing protein